MLDTARILARQNSNLKFIISQAPAVKRNYMEGIIHKHGGSAGFEIITGDVGKVLERCKLVIAASGTVTLEAAICGTPMVIIYKVSPASYWLGRAMVRVKHIGLVNLIAGKEIVPELLQGKASPRNIADKVYEMLSDASGLERLRNELLGINDALGGAGASERVADIAVNML
jgi:lipid-A-disaccharide synthase